MVVLYLLQVTMDTFMCSCACMTFKSYALPEFSQHERVFRRSPRAVGTIDYQTQPAAADNETDTIAGIVANTVNPAALNTDRTSAAFKVPPQDLDHGRSDSCCWLLRSYGSGNPLV